MAKPTETDILLVQLLDGVSQTDLMEALGLNYEIANEVYRQRDNLIATYGEAAFD